MKHRLALIILALLLLCPSFVRADTQTINTVPSADSNFISDLQTFLEDENAERIQTGLTTRVVSGGIGATDASLTHTISAVTAYVEGYYIYDASISHTYTASKDTFVLLRYDDSAAISVSGATITYDGNFVFAEMANGTTQVNAPSGTMMLFEAVTNGTSITTVNDYRTGGIVFLSDPRFADGSNGRLKDAVDTIGSLVVTLYIDCDDVVGTDTTTPSTMTVRVLDGAIISDGGGSASLTINGPFIHPEPSQCFDWTGSGSLSFPSGTFTLLEWSGGTGDNLTTNVNNDAFSVLIDALTTNGGTIVLSKGTYLLDDNIYWKSNVSLYVKNGVTLKFKDSVGDHKKMIDSVTNADTYGLVSNVSLYGNGTGTLDANRTGQGAEDRSHVIAGTGTNWLVEGLIIRGAAMSSGGSLGNGVILDSQDGVVDIQNVIIRDCIFIDNERQDIAVVSGTNIKILNNTFSNNIDIEPEAAVGPYGDVVDVIIDNNRSSFGGISVVLSVAYTQKQIEITNNILYDGLIRTNDVKDLLISGNKLYDPPIAANIGAISVSQENYSPVGEDNIIITDNLIKDGVSSGTNPANSRSAGILVWGYQNDIENVIVKTNIIESLDLASGDGNGILIEKCNDVIIKDNIIKTSAVYRGIYIDTCDRSITKDNIIGMNTASFTGVSSAGLGFSSINNASIGGNSITYSGADTLVDGIIIYSGDEINWSGNNSVVNSGAGAITDLYDLDSGTDFYGIFSGTISLGVNSSFNISCPFVRSTISKVVLFPTNASAAVLQGGANALYHDPGSDVANTSFRVSTAGGGNSAGTETYRYIIDTRSDKGGAP